MIIQSPCSLEKKIKNAKKRLLEFDAEALRSSIHLASAVFKEDHVASMRIIHKRTYLNRKCSEFSRFLQEYGESAPSIGI